jgi:hypothetical protein
VDILIQTDKEVEEMRLLNREWLVVVEDLAYKKIGCTDTVKLRNMLNCLCKVRCR